MYSSESLEEIVNMKEFCIFTLRKWKALLISILAGFVLLFALKLALEAADGGTLSIVAAILYGIVGAVAGCLIFCLWAFCRYRNEGKLRDVYPFFDRYGIFVLGDVSGTDLPQNTAVDRWLNRWESRNNADSQEEWQRIAGRIRAISGNDSHNILITGSGDGAAVCEAYEKLLKNFDENHLQKSENPLYQIEAMEQLQNCQVILVEKKNESLVEEMARLLMFLDRCNVQIIGAIIL